MGDPSVTGATFGINSNTRGACYCERGMSGKFTSSKWATCILPSPNCMWVVSHDGWGRTEFKVGTHSTATGCAEACKKQNDLSTSDSRYRTDRRINGATY